MISEVHPSGLVKCRSEDISLVATFLLHSVFISLLFQQYSRPHFINIGSFTYVQSNDTRQWRTEGGGLGCSNPPRNFEDIGGVLDRTSKKNRRLDFLLQFTVFSYGCNLLNKGFF